MKNETDRWFEEEILVHEASLTRFLRRSWRNQSEVDDIRQEAYVRVYRAALKEFPSSPKSFLFTTARNLLTDLIRRNRIISIEAVGGCKELDDLGLVSDEISQDRVVGSRQELQRLAEALDDLPPRSRQVLWLRRVEEMPQKLVARKLNISEGSVEKALARAVRLLAEKLYSGSADRLSSSRGEKTLPHLRESNHGKC